MSVSFLQWKRKYVLHILRSLVIWSKALEYFLPVMKMNTIVTAVLSTVLHLEILHLQTLNQILSLWICVTFHWLLRVLCLWETGKVDAPFWERPQAALGSNILLPSLLEYFMLSPWSASQVIPISVRQMLMRQYHVFDKGVSWES